MNNQYRQELDQRLLKIVHGTCNKVGCDKCDLKWDGGCSATDLESKIYEIDIQEAKNTDC
nr:hypothetical protein [uncultured Vibrio sp.]